jgi:hypothetical protein
MLAVDKAFQPSLKALPPTSNAGLFVLCFGFNCNNINIYSIISVINSISTNSGNSTISASIPR